MRKPDAPGTHRVKYKDGRWKLYGLRQNGERVRLAFTTEAEAKETAKQLFPANGVSTMPKIVEDWTRTDDWGVPIRVDAAKVDDLNKRLGINQGEGTSPNPSPSNGVATHIAATTVVPKTTTLEPKKDTEAEKARKTRYAHSLMEMVGMAGAMGDVMLAERLTIAAGKEPVKVNPKQVRDLSESLRDTLTEWFGDKDIKPWQMTILLALGIPMTMLIQSPKKPTPKEQEASPKQSVAK